MTELFSRRVPQIIGIYIAATWMMIEIGDWIVERFHIAPEITSYIFIGMIFLIPSVIYLAYQYGKPGPDAWKMATFTIVPSNLVIAFIAMYYLVTPVVTTTKMVLDEKGVQQAYEVPIGEDHQEVVSFFWKNKSNRSELDWLRYGLPWMLNNDLDRSLFISSDSPFSSTTLLKEMKKADYDNDLIIPNPLQITIARKRFSQFYLNGEFDFNGTDYELKVDLIQVNTGKKMASHSSKGSDFFSLLDDLTENIKETLQIPKTIEELSTDLPITEHISASIPALKNFIQAKLKRNLEDDYSGAKELLEQAVKADFSFVYANTELAIVNQLMGNTQEAQIALDNALKHEYKLSEQNKFSYRGMAYGLRGDYASQLKVFDMWLELFPEDIDAHESMVSLLLPTGLDHEKALNSLRKLRELKPDDNSVLRAMAKLFLINNELEKAKISLEKFISLSPQNVSAMVELAEVYTRSTQFELAKKTLEKVTLIERDNLAAAFKLILLNIRVGEFEQAEKALSKMQQEASTPEQKFTVFAGYSNYYLTRGELNKVLTMLDKMLLNSQHLPPIMRVFSVEFQKSYLLAWLGRFDEATNLLVDVRKQLQPPLDGIVDIGHVTVYALAKDKEELLAALAKLELWIKEFPNPIFESVLMINKAESEILEGNYQTAITLIESSIKAMSSTAINLQNEASILEAEIGLARVKMQDGQFESAFDTLTNVLKRSPMLPKAQLALAEYYFSQNEQEKLKSTLGIIKNIWKNADQNYSEYRKYLALVESLRDS